MPAQESETLKLGSLLLVQETETASPLPLESTVVSGTITGSIAQVRVSQRFGNPFKTPVELEYLFPLPHEAAVVDYAITIGSRHIRAEIKEAEAAQRTYDDAVQSGKRASLLQQRRPNLFSIRIGNVQPNETILCELEYEDRLKFEDGAYEFVFPMGITPRYHSPTQSAVTAQSADAAFAQPDEKIAPVEISLNIDAGVTVDDPTSPSHPLKMERASGRALKIGLGASENPHIPNKDFVLRYRAASTTIQTTLWTTPDGDSEIGLLTLIPPRLSTDTRVPPREFIFVLDRSGSMSKEPMDQARNATKACLRALGEQDTFAIQAFDTVIEWFEGKALPVTQKNVDAADRWLDMIASRGGTEILGAIDAALNLPVDPARIRYVVFLTDGSVSADEQAISKVAKGRGKARIFTFGIGPSVNRFLLEKFAQLGRGVAEFIGAGEPIEPSMARFQDRVSYPALRDLTLGGQNVDFWDTYPATLPDLYVDQPLDVATRLKRKDGATIQITGEVSGVNRSFQVLLPTSSESTAVKRLWARARIESLLDQNRQRGSIDEQIRQQIISIALEHRLATAYTSFVAVDSEVTAGGEAQKVLVSVPLPEGLQFENFFGNTAAGGISGIIASPSLAAYSMDARFMSAAPRLQSPPPPNPSLTKRIMRLKDNIDLPTFLRKQKPTGSDMDIGGNAPANAEHPEAADLPDWLSTSQDGTDSVSAEPTSVEPTLDEQVQALARTQKINGSWNDDVEQTATALLIFIQAGHTTRIGNYRPQVQKAATWLKSAATTAQGDALTAAKNALEKLSAATGDDWAI